MNLEYVKEFGNYLLKRGKSRETMHNYTQTIKQLLESSNKTPETLELKDIEDFAYEIKQNYAPNTQRTKLASVKRYLKFIKREYRNTTYIDYEDDKEETGDDILGGVQAVIPEKTPLTREEVEKLFKISGKNPRDHAILKMFFYSAQRVGSIQNLNREDIDFTGKIDSDGNRYHPVRIIRAKGNKTYTIDVNSRAIDSVKRYLEFREEPKEGYIIDNYGRRLYHKDAIFLNGIGGRLLSRAMRNMMKYYAVKCKISKRIHSHIWRHTTITLLDKEGCSEEEIKLLSGHSKLSNAIKTYINPSKEEVRPKIRQALTLNESKPSHTVKPERQEPEIQDSTTDEQILELELKLLKLRKKQEDKHVDGYQ